MEQTMTLKITGKNIDINNELRTLIQKRLDKLAAFLPSPTEGKAEIRYEPTKAAEKRYTVQITVNSRGLILRAEDRAENIRTAIDSVAESMSRQVKRFKEKRNKKGREGSPVRQTKTALPAEQVVETEGMPEEIIRVKRFPLKPMAVAEALDQLELLGHDFFLFVDSDTGRFSCVYRRKDTKYGLIETEPA